MDQMCRSSANADVYVVGLFNFSVQLKQLSSGSLQITVYA